MSVLPTAKASSAAVVVLVLLVSIYMITLRGTNKSNGSSSSRSKPSSRSAVHLHPLNFSPFLGANNFYFSVCSASPKVTD